MDRFIDIFGKVKFHFFYAYTVHWLFLTILCLVYSMFNCVISSEIVSYHVYVCFSTEFFFFLVSILLVLQQLNLIVYIVVEELFIKVDRLKPYTQSSMKTIKITPHQITIFLPSSTYHLNVQLVWYVSMWKLMHYNFHQKKYLMKHTTKESQNVWNDKRK